MLPTAKKETRKGFDLHLDFQVENLNDSVFP